MISPEEKQAVVDLFPFMGDNPVVFDIGSNKGMFSEIVIGEYKDKCSLHLFEPNRLLLDYTKIKFEYEKNINFILAAADKESSKKHFYYFENFNNELSSFYKSKDWVNLPIKETEVQCIRLDGYVISKLGVNSYVDYIKIDCEGYDLNVVVGCEDLLRNNMVGIIQIEYSEHWGRGNHTWQELKDISNKYGYKIYRYIDGNFWGEKSDTPEFDNYFLTKFEIHNYCISGSNANFLLNTVDLPKQDLILEVGAMEGVTTKYMCNNMLNRDNPDARVIVVDPLNDYYVVDDPKYHPEFKNQYQRFKRNTRGLPVELKRGKSQDELPLLNAMRFSFIYLDGDHYSPMPYLDACWCFAILKIGGYLLIDDVNLWMKETQESVYKFINEFRSSLEIIKENYQILIRKTANQYNSLTYDYYK